MKQTFHEWNVPVAALPPQSVTSGASATGSLISFPQDRGLGLSFLIAAKATTPTNVSALRLVVQGSVDNGTTWADLLQNDGVTSLTVPQTTNRGGALDTNFLAGTYPLIATFEPARAKGGYQGFRLNASTVTGSTIVLSAVGVIFNLYTKPPLQDPTVAGQASLTDAKKVYQVDSILGLFLPAGS